MQYTTEQQIQQLRERKYDQNQQSLNLWNQGPIWSDVLKSRDWQMIKSLNVGKNNINEAGIQILIDVIPSRLNQLSLVGCGMTFVEIQKLSNKNFNNLKKLILSCNYIGNTGTKWLVKFYLPSLEELNIVECKIETEGFKQLTKSNWPKINCLSLIKFCNKNENKMELDNWQQIHNNNWYKMDQLYFVQTEPICCINSVLIQSDKSVAWQYNLRIKNKKINNQMVRIIWNRRLLRQY